MLYLSFFSLFFGDPLLIYWRFFCSFPDVKFSYKQHFFAILKKAVFCSLYSISLLYFLNSYSRFLIILSKSWNQILENRQILCIFVLILFLILSLFYAMFEFLTFLTFLSYLSFFRVIYHVGTKSIKNGYWDQHFLDAVYLA